MHFWRTSEAALDMRAGRVGRGEAIQYGMGWAVLIFVGFISHWNFGATLVVWDCVFLLLIAGICWRVNHEGDGKMFFTRFLVLGFVLTFKLIVALGSICVVLFQFIPHEMHHDLGNVAGWIGNAMLGWRMVVWIRFVSRGAALKDVSAA